MTAQIYAKLRYEQSKLNRMPLGDPKTLKQSQMVDRLVVEYYRALELEARRVS